ncbi:biotin--[acetyl-CoA-carboxylase] ligase [Pedobacter panaciterrae]
MQNNTFSTLFVGQNLIRLSAVDSTNNFLKMMVSKSEPLPEGTVIMADNQFAGRGQQENTWYSEPGLNLTFSIFLKPAFLPINKQFMLNIAVSNGINKALGRFVKDGIKVKWPNDIYYNDSKIGGVLIENSLSGNSFKSSIVGIGMNVNQQKFDIEKTKVATSLYEILQHDVNLIELLAEICSHIESQYLQLKAGNYNSLMKEYLENLYRFNKLGFYRQNGEVFEATITRITEAGQLVLLTSGKERIYNFKEVEFLKD